MFISSYTSIRYSRVCSRMKLKMGIVRKSDSKVLATLVYRIDVQDEINMQVGKFLKNIKRAGQNRRVGGKFS